MSSAQGNSSPPTLAEGPEEGHVEGQEIQQEVQVERSQERPVTEPEPEPEPQPQLAPRPEHEHEPQQETERTASSSHSQVFDQQQPPQTPPKDRDSEGRLSVLYPPQFFDWNVAAHPSFTAAAQLMAHDVNRPSDTQAPNMAMASARSLVNQPIAAGIDGTGNGVNAGSTSNVLNRNTTTTITNTHPEAIRRVLATSSGTPPNPDRSQIHLPPSRPLSSIERRTTGPGLISYDPIRGEPSYLPESNGYNGGGDHGGGLNRNVSWMAGAPRPRSGMSPTDGTMVENGPGVWSGSRGALRMASGHDFLVGVPVMGPRPKTLQDRLKLTVDAATAERNKFQKRSSQQSIIINGAIGLQVIVGALTTGVAASGTVHIGAVVAALGGTSTILASYLAKVRGSGEPEFSTIRARELNTFLREVETFLLDHGDEIGSDYDDQVTSFRERFEMIIKTDGEDSGQGSWTGFHPSSSPPPHGVPPGVNLASGQPGTMPGAYDARGPDENQKLCKACKEKAISKVA
ncbi:hypothetical protein BJ322DRAFT_517364 [Thelephora terrestris]|uniref:SMODS and SLOG-associating 2TM effector domain-containing protein n=1 Tax=Thelephora terrestris TaxID=56493 RepID=A0A9P6H5C6_9AGAM|nr:hypothetical protein BJ322DRAFT_517364 [Thelephora terrestris]